MERPTTDLIDCVFARWIIIISPVTTVQKWHVVKHTNALPPREKGGGGLEKVIVLKTYIMIVTKETFKL